VAGIVRPIDSRASNWDVGRADSLFPLKESIGGRSSNMPDLAVDETALSMDSICDSFPSC